MFSSIRSKIILAALPQILPDWFGRPEAIEAYAAEAERLEAVTARADGTLIGLCRDAGVL